MNKRFINLQGLFARKSSSAIERRAMIEGLESRRLLSGAVTTFVPVNPAPITPIIAPTYTPVGVTIHTEVAEAFSGVVGKVQGLHGFTAKQLLAHINWGDGSKVSAGVLSFNAAGTLVINGTHKYAVKGNYAITIHVTTVPPKDPNAIVAPLPIATIHSVADVTADKEGGVTLTEIATQKFTAKIGSFDFTNVDLAITATITWGDGTTSLGTLQHPTLDDFNVIGTHTYAKTGTYKVHVTVTARPIGLPGGPLPQFILLVTSFDSKIIVKGKA